ncbi:MAG: helix-turn-helix transcriptional regulator [Thaumarchaeota archaeon]|nr:helix-turn-helix transcriptional regulator [Nitrososphaerota archaeon]
MLEIQGGQDKEIQDLLSDKASRIILESIMTTAKSTSQICTECSIPTSTAYRKMQKLADRKVIRKIGTINESGKREILYKGNFSVLKKVLG